MARRVRTAAQKKLAAAATRRYYAKNREKCIAYNRIWKKDHPEMVRVHELRRPARTAQMRNARLRNLYWLDSLAFSVLLAEQGGVCAACGGGGEMTVDHDHSCCPGRLTCGRCVRGILCSRCNAAAGQLGDSHVRASRLAAYLLRTRS